MSAVTERLQLLITTAGAKAAEADIASVGTASEVSAEKQTLLQKAQKSTGLEGAKMGTLLAGGALVGGAAIAKFALDGVQQFADLTGQVRGFQRVAGTTAEDSSKLVFAMRELGIEPDVAATSFGRLETRLGTGKAKLEEYGITTKDASGKTLDASVILGNIAEAYQGAETQSEKAAIGNEAFGKGWQKLAPILGKSKEDLKALFDEAGRDHQIFTADDLEKGRQFNLATAQLKDALKGLEVEVGSAVIPEITKLTSAVTTGIHAFDEAVNSVDDLTSSFDTFAHGIPVLKDLDSAAGGSASAIGGVKDTVERALNPFKSATDAVGSLGDALGIGGDDAASYSDKQQKVADATKKVADAISQHGKNSKEAHDAERELSSASKDLKKDQDDVDGALQKVNDGLKDTAKNHQDAATATAEDKAATDQFIKTLDDQAQRLEKVQSLLLQSQGGEIGRQEAVIAATKAQDDYNGAVFLHGEGSKEAIDASLNLQQARLAETQATLDANKAQQDFTASVRDSPAAVQAEIDRLQDSINKYGDADGALQSQIDKLNFYKGVLANLAAQAPIVTPVTVDTSGANSALDVLERRLSTLVNSPWHVGVSVGAPTQAQRNLANLLEP